MNKHMAAKLSSLPCFEASWAIFRPDLCSHFSLYVGAGFTCMFLIFVVDSKRLCTSKFLEEKVFPWASFEAIFSLKGFFCFPRLF